MNDKILEIKKVLERKDKVKMVIIPKKSKLKKDELVLITNDLSLAKEVKNDRS